MLLFQKLIPNSTIRSSGMTSIISMNAVPRYIHACWEARLGTPLTMPFWRRSEVTMLFTEPRFAIFFLILFVLYWSLRSNGVRKVTLLIASYIFYGAWDWRFA